MKTEISNGNPFGYNRYGFLWEVLKKKGKGIHLDYGAYDGKVLNNLSKTGVIDYGIGVDLNREIVEGNYNKMYQNVKLDWLEEKTQLPFDSQYFDTISILDVLEHIHDQETVLNELNRVLKKNGLLVITVPQKHLFSFLDVGNFKFIFPRLHRLFYIRQYSYQEYKEKYVDCKNGLFGDVEKEKKWHQHFSFKELEDLLKKCGFVVEDFDGSGLFTRPLGILNYFVPSLLKRVIFKLIKLDYRTFSSMNLFCISKKI